ncbi:MAG: hypothetical protein Q9223_003665 [Gallowayella weberi]
MPDLRDPVDAAAPASTLSRNKRRRHTSPHEDEQTAKDIGDPVKRHQHVDTRHQSAKTSESQSIPLQLPLPCDKPQTLEAKLTAILATVSSGQSLAAATHYLATPHLNRDPIAKAMQEMGPYERMQWDAYTADPQLKLPVINWATNLDTEPTSARPLKNAQRRAEALNRLYKTDQARPGHAVWFTKHHMYLLPLVKAVARVIGAERDLCGGDKGDAMADLQTVNAVLGVLGEMISTGKVGIDGNLIARVQAVLGMERMRLRASVG